MEAYRKDLSGPSKDEHLMGVARLQFENPVTLTTTCNATTKCNKRSYQLAALMPKCSFWERPARILEFC